jgi:hypothetical protein
MIETHRLDHAAEAYARMMAGEARFRMVLTNNEDVRPLSCPEVKRPGPVQGIHGRGTAAMKERVQELKAAARRGPLAHEADRESHVLAKIADMPEPDRAMAERLHAIIKASAPALSPKAWWMPAYAKDGNVSASSRGDHGVLHPSF